MFTDGESLLIEFGMAIQLELVRVVLTSLVAILLTIRFALELVIQVCIHEMLNGIAPTIIFVRASTRLSFDDEESFKEAAGSLCFYNPPSDPNTLQRVGSSSSSNMPPRERPAGDEDICFNNPPSDPNTLQVRRVGSSSNAPP